MAALAVMLFVPAPVQAQGQGSLVTRVQALEAAVAALQTTVAALTAKLAAVTVESGPVNGLAGPHFVFTGVNVHVRSGSGFTDDGGTPTGLGNLIVGYNEEPEPPDVLQRGDRGGAHTLVVGPAHRFRSVGGSLAGFRNNVSGKFATVSGGGGNTASGDFASVSGGAGNTASGQSASVSGGAVNTAIGEAASISGGFIGSAPGLLDWRAGDLFQDYIE